MNRNHRWMWIMQLTVGLAVAFVFASSSADLFGHGSGGDIAIFSTTTTGGEKVDVGFAILDEDDIHQIFFDPNDSVFNNILLPRTPQVLPPIPWTMGSPEPGLDADEGELAPLQPLNLNVLNMKFWDGSGAVNFGALPAGVTGGYAPQPSLTFADGGHHSHPVFGLQGGGTPDGVYLTTAKVHIQTMIDSDPYYKVSLVDRHLYTGDEEMDAENAEALGELVRAYLADPNTNPEPVFNGKNYTYYADAIRYAEGLVPEPGTSVLVTLGLAGVLAIRRRRIET